MTGEWVRFGLSSTLGVLGLLVGLRQLDNIYDETWRSTRIDLCTQASDKAARLASLTSPNQWQTARTEFEVLYWGPLAVVENKAVEAAMVRFRAKLPGEGEIPANLPLQYLKKPALEIARQCKAFVSASPSPPLWRKLADLLR